ncbi:MAG TPA: SPOR domain-containing protein [Luteimonas sp.]|nr:SPOR domain-containing protein [Luteimonas sp.]
MMLRAAVVLLLVLNAGLAAWWLARPPLSTVEAAVPLASPRLRLVGEPVDTVADAGRPSAAARATPGAAAAAGVTATVATAAVPDAQIAGPGSIAPGTPSVTALPAVSPVASPQCASIGPFADAAAAAGAQRVLADLGILRASVREVTASPRGWQVRIAPQADRAAADAMAGRIATAGFDDYLVVPSGDGANGIALGRYRGERAARDREAALRAAGFQAVTEPVGEASTRRWLDFAVPAGFDVEAARRATAAAGSSVAACGAPGPAGSPPGAPAGQDGAG